MLLIFKFKLFTIFVFLANLAEIISGFPQLSDAVNFSLRRVKGTRRALINFNSTEAKSIRVSGLRNFEGKLTYVEHTHSFDSVKAIPSDTTNVLFHENVKHRVDISPNSVHPSSKKENCGKTYCEHIDDYPFEHIATLDLSPFDVFFDEEGIKHLARYELRKLNIVESGDVPEQRMCTSQKKMLTPRDGFNKDGVWRRIINQDKRRQTVIVDFCGDTSQLSSKKYQQPEIKSSCNSEVKFPEKINRTECRQSYGVRKLVALDSNGNSFLDEFMFPTYCQCILIKNQQEVVSQ